jgi:hypothetical protein
MDEHVLDLDKPRRLRFGFRATRLIREKFGSKKDLTDVLDVHVDEVPFFAYAGLVWEDESLTPEKVEELIDNTIPDKYKVMDIVNIIIKAIADQIGLPSEKKKKKTSSKSTGKSRSKSA